MSCSTSNARPASVCAAPQLAAVPSGQWDRDTGAPPRQVERHGWDGRSDEGTPETKAVLIAHERTAATVKLLRLNAPPDDCAWFLIEWRSNVGRVMTAYGAGNESAGSLTVNVPAVGHPLVLDEGAGVDKHDLRQGALGMATPRGPSECSIELFCSPSDQTSPPLGHSSRARELL